MSCYKADVIIAGGGPAGCVAAIAAACRGAVVLLVEGRPFLGGCATGGRVHSMLTFHSRQGRRIVGGIPERIIERLKAAGGSPGHIRDTVGVAYSVTPTDPDVLSSIFHLMLKEAGVNLLLESRVIRPVVKSGRITAIEGVHPGGVFTAKAPVYIDATGSGELGAGAGCGFETGRNGQAMPATLIFEVSGVKISKTVAYALANRSEFHGETCFDLLESSPAPGFSGFFSLWKKASLSVPRDRLLLYGSVKPGTVGINSTRITPFNPLSPEDFTRARYDGIRQALEIFEFVKMKVPGFEKSIISSFAPFLGVREVRRLQGIYRLEGADLAAGRRFSDEVAFGGFPVDIHQPGGRGIETAEIGGAGFYGIPYRCLVARDVSNLLMAGKCISADFSAHASARVQATSMACGEAAGVAGAICAMKSVEPAALDPDAVRGALADSGAILEPDGRNEELS